jgi:hypothetical protein
MPSSLLHAGARPTLTDNCLLTSKLLMRLLIVNAAQSWGESGPGSPPGTPGAARRRRGLPRADQSARRGPQLSGLFGGQRVVGGIHLDQAELAGVLAQPLLRRVGLRRVPARGDQRPVGPRRCAHPDPSPARSQKAPRARPASQRSAPSRRNRPLAAAPTRTLAVPHSQTENAGTSWAAHSARQQRVSPVPREDERTETIVEGG